MPGEPGKSLIPISIGITVHPATPAIGETLLLPSAKASATAAVTLLPCWVTPLLTTPLSAQNTSSSFFLKDNSSEPKTRQRHEHIMRSIHTIKDVDFDFDEIYVASFPEPSDPDEYIRTYGVKAFRDLLERAVPYWKYLSDYMSIR